MRGTTCIQRRSLDTIQSFFPSFFGCRVVDAIRIRMCIELRAYHDSHLRSRCPPAEPGDLTSAIKIGVQRKPAPAGPLFLTVVFGLSCLPQLSRLFELTLEVAA